MSTCNDGIITILAHKAHCQMTGYRWLCKKIPLN